MAQQRILIILLNFRTPEMTLQSAEAALRELEDLPGELLIIDNGSGDGSFDQIRAAAEARGWLDSNRVRVTASPVNGGFGAGMNIGLHTRLYFDDEDNNTDPVLQLVEQVHRRDTLIARKIAPGHYCFDIHLQGEAETVFMDV